MTDKDHPNAPTDVQQADGDNHAEAGQPPTTSADAATDPATEEGSPTKRRRGRPKGSKNKPRSGAEGTSSATQPEAKRKRGRPPKERKQDTTGEGGNDTEPPVKRPRGRPRKHPLPETGNNGEGEEEAGSGSKKRGRPAKPSSPKST